ncbi:MAG: hypothetical protein LBC41_04240, partial [Clostridiales bacterium]|nr:hypothetical protein [Clostridiales bacterium]
MITLKSNYLKTARVIHQFLINCIESTTFQVISNNANETVIKISSIQADQPVVLLAPKPIKLRRDICIDHENYYGIMIQDCDPLMIEDLFDKFQFFIGGAYERVFSAEVLESIKVLIKACRYPSVRGLQVSKFGNSLFCEKHGLETLGDLLGTDYWDIDLDEARDLQLALSSNLPGLISAVAVKKRLLDGLPDRTKYVIENRLFNITETLKDIATKFDLSKQRILQICQDFEQKVKSSDGLAVIRSLFHTLKYICDCEHCFSVEELTNYGISERFLMTAAELLGISMTHIADTEYIAFCENNEVEWLKIVEKNLGSFLMMSVRDWNQLIIGIAEKTKLAGYVIPVDIIEVIWLREHTKANGYVYLKSITASDKFRLVLSHHFPDGIRLFKLDEIDAFRKKYEAMFSDTKPPSGSAITAKIKEEGHLVDCGVYVLNPVPQLPESLKEQIKNFIHLHPYELVKTEAILHKFRKELSEFQVTNKHHLQSVLRKALPAFIYRNDYVLKWDSFSSDITRLLEQHPNGASLQTLASQLSIVTPQSIAFALTQNDSAISKSPNMYIHKNFIKCEEQKALYGFLRYIVPHDRFISDQHAFDQFCSSFPQFLVDNTISTPYYLFGVLRSFFGHDFNFSRPFIVDLSCDCDSENFNGKDSLRSTFWGNNLAGVKTIKKYANDMMIPFYDMSRLLNSFNDGYFIRDTEFIVRIEEIGYGPKEYQQVEDIVSSALGNLKYCEISALPDIFSLLPKSKVKMTDWLVYSILNKYGTLVSVISSSH